VLCRGGRAIELSQDHKPGLPGEWNRITRAGGFVEGDRVNGDLATSRAIGDLEYKQDRNLPRSLQVLSVTPDVGILARSPSDEFIILACDGVWDVLSSQEAVDFVRREIGPREEVERRVLAGDLKLSAVTSRMLDFCIGPSKGSRDNMTAILVVFTEVVPAFAPSPQKPWGLWPTSFF